MEKVTTSMHDSSIESRAAHLRIALNLTQQELAERCGVSQEEVDLFERNLPVRLEAKIKLRKVLWASRNALCHTFPR